MKASKILLAIAGATSLLACSGDKQDLSTDPLLPTATARIVNARASSIDVLIDGNVIQSGVAAGTVVSLDAEPGTHQLAFRQTGTTTATTTPYTAVLGKSRTFAAVTASNGSIASAALDDTSSIVPAGATKLRVLHLAPNAGTIIAYRTQPDFATPVSWQFPFNYNPEPSSLSAPFYQSTVGTWELRIWQSPADASGWDTAPVKLSIPLASGQRRTVVVLDKPGGGVRTEIID